GDLGRIGANRLHDLASLGNHGLDRRSHAVTPDVDEQPWHARRRTANNPGAAHCASGIVEGDGAIAASPKSPPKDLFVELRRPTQVDRRNLNVTDFSVRIFIWHMTFLCLPKTVTTVEAALFSLSSFILYLQRLAKFFGVVSKNFASR